MADLQNHEAAKIARALGATGLVMVTGRIGGADLRVYGRPELSVFNCDYAEQQADAQRATARALGLAMLHKLPVIIRFEPAGAK
ncbi:hypothetical protein [Altericroceibacterium xinjiangense]|uniref:hypothetical protein n=1 Tax=Altericroceibacterium xinjiangense TaxID=762261 RepID=UPI000F7F3FFE|nr:hypothetical protein [Altericroceibacterium xinjiangense]